MLNLIRGFAKRVLHQFASPEIFASVVVSFWRWRNLVGWVYEPEREVLAQFIKPGDLVVDIGLNYGQYAVAMARLVGPQGKVIGFEALPSTFELSRRIVRMSNIDIHNVAISNEEGIVRMALLLDENGIINRGASKVIQGTSQDLRASFVEVRSVRLDDMIAEQGQRVSFIKCDIEGHEIEALNGAGRILKKDRPNILVETSPSNLKKLIDILSPLGYKPMQCDIGRNLVPLGIVPSETFNCFFLQTQ